MSIIEKFDFGETHEFVNICTLRKYVALQYIDFSEIILKEK